MMRIKLDENIPVTAKHGIQALGHDVDTVLEEALGGRDDEAVWAASQTEARFFVTQDLDFSDLRKFRPGTHHGLMLVRLPDEEQPLLPAYLEGWFSAMEGGTWEGCFVVATPRKLRVVSRKSREASQDA
jgi:predicted nuclease of predicted toxin-antitoxin system